jgi:hypothetical protein
VPGNEEVKVSILGFVTMSLGDWCQLFGGSIVVSSSRVKMSVKKKKKKKKKKKVIDIMRRTDRTIIVDISVS